MGKLERLRDEDLSTLDRTKRKEVKRLQRDLNSAVGKGNTTEESKLCNTIGEILAEAGLLQLALRYHMHDLEISTQSGKPIDIAVAHRKVGEVYSELGEFEPAITHQTHYMEIVKSLSDLIELQRAHATLGRTFYTQLIAEPNEQSDLRKKSGKHYSEALQLTQKLREKGPISEEEIREMRARLYLNIGLLYDKCSQSLSNRYLAKALNESRDIRATAIQHRVLMQLCENSVLEGDHSTALSHGQEAMKINKNCENNVDLAESMEMISLVYLHLDRFTESRRNAKEALKINSDLDTAMSVYKACKLIISLQEGDFGVEKEVVAVLAKIADVFMKLGMFLKGVDYLKKELKTMQRLAMDNDSLAEVHGKLGLCYSSLDNGKLSLYHYTQQISLAPSATSWTHIAILSMKEGQSYQECWDAIQAGFEISKDPQDQLLCLQTLLKIAQKFGEKEVEESATKELEALELEESQDTQSQDVMISDVELSESENDCEGDEERAASRPARGKRNTLGKVNEKGETPLHQAAVAGNANKVRELLAKHASPNTRDHAGWTPLHEACNYGYIEIVELLVEAGADINDRGGSECDGITPLHDATQCGNLAIVKFLIERGAHVLAKDDMGRTALQLVETMVNDDEDDDDVSRRNKLAMKEALQDAINNPRRPAVKTAASKRIDSSDLFTTGSNFSSSTQKYSKHDVPSSISDVSVSSQRVGRNNNRASDSAIGYKKHVSTLPRTAPSKQRYSEPLRRPKQPSVDEWLVKDHSSPKRKQPTDPFLSKTSDKKRSKQSRLSTTKTEVTSTNEIPVCSVKPDIVVVKSETRAPVPCDKMLRIKIRIRDVLFLIPVQGSVHTMADLAEMASQRYKTKVGLLPKLSLTTADGALLNSEDIAAHLLTDGEELVGVIEESPQDSLVDKYTSTCQRLDLEPIFKENLTLSNSMLSISRTEASPKHLECLLTTLICSTNITNLNLSYNTITRDALVSLTTTLPTLTSLNCLNLAGCGIKSEVFPKICDSLKDVPLHSLDLAFNTLSTSFVRLLELTVSLPDLQTLSVKNCSMESSAVLPIEISEKFSNCKLTSLNLSQNRLTHFPKLPKGLQHLWLGGSDVFSQPMVLPEMLESVSLENCSLNNSSIESAGFAGLRKVSSFSAPHNNITSEGVVGLLMLLPSLTFLDLSGNPLGCTGVEELALVAPPNLSVKLQNCGAEDLTCDAVATLAESLKSCDISYNRINYPKMSRGLSGGIRTNVFCQNNVLRIGITTAS